MLVYKGLVDADIVVAPTEMCHRRGLVSCACAADDSMHVDVVVEHQVLGQWEQAERDAGGKVSRVGNQTALAYSATIEFGQAIDKLILIALQAETARKVDDLEFLGNIGTLHKLLALLGIGTEEQ